MLRYRGTEICFTFDHENDATHGLGPHQQSRANPPPGRAGDGARGIHRRDRVQGRSARDTVALGREGARGELVGLDEEEVELGGHGRVRAVAEWAVRRRYAGAA